jgi:RadC-like JAB domain
MKKLRNVGFRIFNFFFGKPFPSSAFFFRFFGTRHHSIGSGSEHHGGVFGGGHHGGERSSFFSTLCRYTAIGMASAAQVMAVLELARRLTVPNQLEQYQIRSPADAANLVSSQMAFLDHEELRVLCLDTKNHVVANIKLYQGTLNSSVLRVAEVFRPAITRNCAGIIICHNHPSGDPKPSPVIWRKICQGQADTIGKTHFSVLEGSALRSRNRRSNASW